MDNLISFVILSDLFYILLDLFYILSTGSAFSQNVIPFIRLFYILDCSTFYNLLFPYVLVLLVPCI